jgi:hypothetical protein
MTVQSTLARQPYIISGAGPYAIPFYFLADTDIIAIRTPAGGGDPVTLALTTDYTLTGAGDKNGGALTLVTPVNGDTLTIINEPPISQLTQYPETGKFPAASHERALDKLTNVAKRVYDLASRSLRLNDGDPATSLQLPVSSPGKLIGWGPSGELANTSPAGVGPGSITPTELDRSYQPLNGNLTAEAGLTGAADNLPYYTGSGLKALTNFFAWGRLFLAAADVAAARIVLGVSTGTVTSVTGTAPVTSSGGATPAISMNAATVSSNGYMTSTQATKLAGIATGATVGIAADVGAGAIGSIITTGIYSYPGNSLASNPVWTPGTTYAAAGIYGVSSGTWRCIHASNVSGDGGNNYIYWGTFQRIA